MKVQHGSIDSPTRCTIPHRTAPPGGGVFLVCFCGGLLYCFCGGFVVRLGWCFCGGVLVFL